MQAKEITLLSGGKIYPHQGPGKSFYKGLKKKKKIQLITNAFIQLHY